MILILTTEAGDFSHPGFVDWLEYYRADYKLLWFAVTSGQF
jgi:hypothetical protein